jgi:MEMO1 family protein
VSEHIRPSIIAGQWYPGNTRELTRTIERFFAQVDSTELEGTIVALISPHAGYAYSGQTAAYAYHQIRHQSFDVVVVISPVHRMPVGRFAITKADAYETPLGLLRLDHDLIESLGERIPLNRVGYDGEHSIEIQLPFLQLALGDVRLLPIMIGVSSFEAGEELGTALIQVLQGRKALIVASTDLHHIEDYSAVVRRDQVVSDAIASFDMRAIRKALSPADCSVCGRIPVYATLTAAQGLGADKVKILHHTTSGDVTGIRAPGQYTVGYLAAAAYQRL